jgi:cytochrome c biogenesis protein CcmG/thiol:disulfide interchange protein DsbE
MKPRIILAGVFTAAMATAPFFGVTAPGVDDYPPAVLTKTLYADHDYRGKMAPEITAQTWLTGKAPDTKGKVVLLDFWATWCPPCRATIPELGKWAKQYPQDLVVIGISQETEKTVSDFMKTTPMPYYVGIDSTGASEKAVGVKGIPHVLVISADGIVRWQGFPLDEKDTLTDKKLAQIIKTSKAASTRQHQAQVDSIIHWGEAPRTRNE